MTDHVTIRNNVTVTLEAGTSVTICGDYQISISGGGNLRATGTETDPIVFDADNPAVKWSRILFSGAANHSILQHVILNNGGGNNPTATAGTLEFAATLEANPLPSPTLDHVTVNHSGAYGLYLQVNSNDVSPPSITHLTVHNSARAAVLANAQALGGFGRGNIFTDNAPNTVQVIHGGASRLYRNQIWRGQGVPYEMLGMATVAAASSADPYPTLKIEAGTVFLMHPGAGLDIGTSLGRGGALVVEGTEDSPVTFTRLESGGAHWDKLRLTLYPGTKAALEYVELSHGGSGGPAMIEQFGSGSLTLNHVTVLNSLTAGLNAQGGVNVNNSTFEFNQTGLELSTMASAVVRNSVIRNNFEAGLVSLDAGFDDNCIDAIGNFWGSPDGPFDDHGSADACGNARTNGGGGDGVSGGVLYQPWLPGDGALLDRSIIKPDSFYVVADGVDSTQVEIILRDAQGGFVSGKQLQLNATLGDVIQPLEVTDINGKTAAVVSSAAPGFAYLSAHNLTDDEPLSGLGGVTFWQGSGDAGGLIDPGGAPFASPQLHLTGKPYQVGFPIGMRVPMQNSNPQALDVEVVYGVGNLLIGLPFSPVFTTSMTLQPGESWDAEGVWLPTSEGHRCIQATITSSDSANALTAQDGQDPSFFQKILQENTDQDPCTVPKFDPYGLTGKGGINTVARLLHKFHYMSKHVNECPQFRLFPPSDLMAAPLGIDDTRDYQKVVTPPPYDPPEILAEGDVTQQQADVLNLLAQTAADLLSLNVSIGATAQRMNWAAQTLDEPASDGLYYLSLQFQAFRGFTNQYADKLDLYADQIDALLILLDETSDPYFLAEEFHNIRDELAANGFDDEERIFYEETGLDPALIDQLAQDLVKAFDSQAKETIQFSVALAGIQANSRSLAQRLRMQYSAPAAQLLAVQASPTVFVDNQTFSFEVGQPFAEQKTVDLVVRPVSLPLGWTYDLSQHSITLGAGEIAEVDLTLFPSGHMLEGDLVQVTVEGYVDDELIGGLLLEHLVPSLTPVQDLIFADGFEP